MRGSEHSPWGKPPNDNEPESDKKSSRSFIIFVIAVVIVITAIAWFLSDGLSTGLAASLAYDFLLLALIGAALIGHVLSNPGQSLRNIAGWVLIFGILGLGYSIWNGNGRLAAEFNPAAGIMDENAITYRADRSGHYFVKADINGSEIDFMVDTGATHIVLNMQDAEKIGYDLDQLSFSIPASTANGTVYSAPVKFDSVIVGPIRVENVEGFVNQGELDISLLGMSFLNQLSGYEVRDGLLTLYP
ncbi:MAG: TIGR02281 family clan AA aspartic protease [Kordiimonadaceae bacterium]|nr:TIGR02281 family clan AA aspartic protease [Kordiimonadaceae bacterium]MBT6037064.1 TIGR02281 family clan AA aspartic protease [Kordiimonadaceae bacterium]MBT6330309.1 TIGR02281 family clan AA aspartic protease [Kordiimonadaceae bacterium]